VAALSVVIVNLVQLQAENSDITMPPSVASFVAACKQKRESRPQKALKVMTGPGALVGSETTQLRRNCRLCVPET
jgi:hypothetical protein